MTACLNELILTHMAKNYATTKEGLEKMKKELEEMKNIRRPEIAERIAKAKELGDLSENAEYHDAKEALGFLEGRILELQDFISHAVVSAPTSTDEVTVGCKVRCEVKGKEREFHLVGSNESDPAAGKISSASPLGQALMGREKGEEFDFEAPSGPIGYKILDITC